MEEEKKNWLEEIGGNPAVWIVRTKGGIFKIKELTDEQMERARARATIPTSTDDANAIRATRAILSDSIIEAELADGRKLTSVTEEDIKNMGGATTLKLKSALNKIYDIENFL